MVLSCEFMPDNNYIVSTTLEGDINIHSLKDDFGILRHESIAKPHLKSNIAYCCRPVRELVSEADRFLVGSEDKVITKYEFDGSANSLESLGEFSGHTGGVRNI